jgi:hypothetical protein
MGRRFQMHGTPRAAAAMALVDSLLVALPGERLVGSCDPRAPSNRCTMRAQRFGEDLKAPGACQLPRGTLTLFTIACFTTWPQADHLAVTQSQSAWFSTLAGSHDLQLTCSGEKRLREFGIDIDKLREASRPLTRACLDWSEQREHLAGALGAAIYHELLIRRWITRMPEPRIIRLTPAGRIGTADVFGLTVIPSPAP